MMYTKGNGVAQDYRRATDWLRKTAELGDAQAQYNLGVAYDQGQGVAQDYKQAVTWFRKAAEQGYISAQYNLGVMYANGNGVAQNYKLAYVWHSVAAANGDTDAPTQRDIVAKKLTTAVLADAQALAGQYFEKYQPQS